MDFLIFQVPMLTVQAVLDGLLLGILFALPNSKNFKIKIQKIIQNNEIDTLEKLFMQFFDEYKNTKKLVSNLI